MASYANAEAVEKWTRLPNKFGANGLSNPNPSSERLAP